MFAVSRATNYTRLHVWNCGSSDEGKCSLLADCQLFARAVRMFAVPEHLRSSKRASFVECAHSVEIRANTLVKSLWNVECRICGSAYTRNFGEQLAESRMCGSALTQVHGGQWPTSDSWHRSRELFYNFSMDMDIWSGGKARYHGCQPCEVGHSSL